MAVGSLVAMWPRATRAWLPGALAYRSVFALAGLSAAAYFALLYRISDEREQPPPAPTQIEQRRDERHRLIGLMGVNLLNGLGISLVGPFLAYWFYLRFGVGPRQIRPVMSAGFVLAGLSTLFSGRVIALLGLVDTVVVMRFFGLVFLLTLPFSPNRWGATGADRTVRRAEPRGLATTLGTGSTQVPRALGPLLGGYLFDADLLAVPFVVAALFQEIYLGLYRRLFRRLPVQVDRRGRAVARVTAGLGLAPERSVAAD